MLRTVSTTLGTVLSLLAGAAGGLDLLARRSRELRCGDGQLLRELAVAEDLDSVVLSLDQAFRAKRGLVDRGAVVEALQIRDVHDRVVALEDVGEAALRQAPV